MPTDLASTETQEESVSLLFLDQDLGSTDTQKESQSLLKKEKVDEESKRGKARQNCTFHENNFIFCLSEKIIFSK